MPFQLLIDEATYQAIWNQAKKSDRMKSVRIYFDKPYDEVAFWLEHGTGPAKRGGTDIHNDGYSGFDRIGGWTTKRFPELTGKKLKGRAFLIYDSIMATGTPPHPFMRPAIDNTVLSGKAGEILEKGGTTEDVAEELVNDMKYYLAEGDHVRLSNGLTSIYDSIHIGAVSDEDDESESVRPTEDLVREWEMLDDKMESQHQQLRADYKSGRAGRRRR